MFCTARVAPEKAVFRPALPLHFLPGIAEMRMATMTYKEQLLHPNWQRRRLEILQRDEFRCTKCCDDESTLHVHHKRYVKGRMVWEYSDHELISLCHSCHSEVHAESAAMKELLARLPVDGPACSSDALSLLAGWAHGEQGMDFQDLFKDNPWSFLLGQLANRLAPVRMDEMLDLLDALCKAPSWVVRAEIAGFANTLRAKAETPSPYRLDGDEL